MELTGEWFIPNPDRGEALPHRRARLLIGGRYHFNEDGSFVADVQLRDRRSRTFDECWRGCARSLGDGWYQILYSEGVSDTFRRVDGRTLRRVSSTRGTYERDLVLTSLDTESRGTLAQEPRCPSIFFNTMPKSGSIYISRWLAQGLRLREMKVAVCLFPDDLVIREKLDEFARGGAITQQHVPAKDINLRFIAARVRKVVLHVRDPRQATLSWVHHLDNFYAHRDAVPACRLGLEAVSPPLPPDYFTWSLSDRIDYQLETHLPALVEWTDRWLRAAADRPYGLEVFLSTYESFFADPAGGVRKILDYCGIPHDAFDWTCRPALTAETHFRKGLSNEWSEVFTAEQRRRAEELIPPHLALRLGWISEHAPQQAS